MGKSGLPCIGCCLCFTMFARFLSHVLWMYFSVLSDTCQVNSIEYSGRCDYDPCPHDSSNNGRRRIPGEDVPFLVARTWKPSEFSPGQNDDEPYLVTQFERPGAVHIAERRRRGQNGCKDTRTSVPAEGFTFVGYPLNHCRGSGYASDAVWQLQTLCIDMTIVESLGVNRTRTDPDYQRPLIAAINLYREGPEAESFMHSGIDLNAAAQATCHIRSCEDGKIYVDKLAGFFDGAYNMFTVLIVLAVITGMCFIGTFCFWGCSGFGCPGCGGGGGSFCCCTYSKSGYSEEELANDPYYGATIATANDSKPDPWSGGGTTDNPNWRTNNVELHKKSEDLAYVQPPPGEAPPEGIPPPPAYSEAPPAYVEPGAATKRDSFAMV